jgi:cytochrome c-type biogenesis protein CcmH
MQKAMPRIQRTGLLILLSLVLSVLLASRVSTVLAQQPTPSDNDVNKVAKQLYCPVCENIPLDVCPTQACAEWRELIRQKLAAGWTDQQIRDYFAVQYGDRVLSEPPQRGLNWLVYFLPPLFFLGGALLVYSVLRKMRSVPTRQNVEPVAGAPVDPYLLKVEEELKKHKG